MKTALPSSGLRGVEKSAESRAWTNSMAESGRESRRWRARRTLPGLPHDPSAPANPPEAAPSGRRPSLHTPARAASGRPGTWHSERLGKSVESGAPGDLPGRDVGQHETQLVQQVPQLQGWRGEGRGTRTARRGGPAKCHSGPGGFRHHEQPRQRTQGDISDLIHIIILGASYHCPTLQMGKLRFRQGRTDTRFAQAMPFLVMGCDTKS